jgi:hypothetical protein
MPGKPAEPPKPKSDAQGQNPPSAVLTTGDAPAATAAPHDVWGYRIAVGGISLGLFAFVLGAAIVGASGHMKELTQEYWTIGAGLSGALVGILVPSPIQRREAKTAAKGPAKTPASEPAPSKWYDDVGSYAGAGALALVFLLSLFLEARVKTVDAEQLRAIAAASGGALVGMLARSPTPSKLHPGAPTSG